MKRKHGLSIKERLLRNVTKNPDTGCWTWRLTLHHTGYADINIQGRKQRAHRVAYEEFIGAIPNGLFVCHSCDNRACCNPEHLWLGTTSDNMQDMAFKGRTGKGKKSNLPEETLKEILAAEGTQKELATRFGLTQSYVSHLLRTNGVYRGRGNHSGRKGIAHPRALFDAAQLDNIRNSLDSLRNLAKTYNCSPSTIQAIKSGRNYSK